MDPTEAAGPTPADLELSAQLDSEMRTAWAAKSRMELLSANIAAEGILRQWPDAALPADGVLGPEVRGALTPWAILDTDGEVRDDDREMWDELEIGADVTGVISNLSDGGGDCWSTRRSQCPGPICCSTGRAATSRRRRRSRRSRTGADQLDDQPAGRFAG